MGRFLLACFLVAAGCADLDDRRPPRGGSGGGSIVDGGGWVVLDTGRGGGGGRGDGPRDAGGGGCRLESDCPPGTFCSDAGVCTFDCRMNSDCDPTGAARSLCVNGRCVPAREPCATDRDCGPPGRVCEDGSCAAGCLTVGCRAGSGEVCNPQTGRCEPSAARCGQDEDCPEGSVCNRALRRCESRVECLRDGDCPEGQSCDTLGRCVEAPPPPPARCRSDRDCTSPRVCEVSSGECVSPPARNLPLGADCRSDDQCASGQCLALVVAGRPASVCTRICCGGDDCPSGFGCLYFSGVQQCLPSRIFPAGTRFDGDPGTPCSAAENPCRSGLCGDNLCLETCCTSEDCGGLPCRFLAAGNTTRPACDLFGGGFGQGVSGQPCFSEFDCLSSVCVPAGGGVGVCADLCCSPADCPGLPCVQVNVGGGIAHACVSVPTGPGAVGSRCSGPAGGDGCASGLCIGNECTTVCCEDDDCQGGRVCRSRDNGEGSRIRVCVEP